MSENTQQSPAAKYVQVTLEVNAELGIVSATLSETAVSGSLNANQLYQMLSEKQVESWSINESAIDDVINKFKKNVHCRIVIAERQDAGYSLTLADDAMSASVKYRPAKGGKSLSEDEVYEALSQKRVDKKRIHPHAVKQLIESAEERTVVIATGKPPVSGRDSQFIQLLDNPRKDAPLVEDDNGVIDFLAGQEYLTVEAGTPLMERIPPQPGKVGMDIYGQIIPAESGKELPFANKLEGTELSANDPNLLLAKVSGHPVYLEDGARVDDTLTFQNIDVSTGHVEFDGSISVTGDIMPDMKVKVTGDIFVKGVVERATVEAGNDITINGGILGDTQIEINEDDDTLPNFECTVVAGGSIQARYVNLAQLSAKQNIIIREYSFNSLMKAHSNILLGQDGGKGNIVGGKTIAGHAVIAKTLGNKAYNRTKVRVGISRDELQKTQKLKFLREQRLDQARNLKKILEELKNQNAKEKLGQVELDKAKKIHETLVQLQKDIHAIDVRLNEYSFAVFTDSDPNISSSSACYPNCVITINGAQLHTKQEHKAITFIKRGRNITAKS